MKNRHIAPLLSGLIVGTITGGLAFWIFNNAPREEFIQYDLWPVIKLFFITPFLLGCFMIWIYRFIGKHLKIRFTFLRIVLAIVSTLILAVIVHVLPGFLALMPLPLDIILLTIILIVLIKSVSK